MFSQRRKQEGILCTNDHSANLWIHKLPGKFNFLTHVFVCDTFAPSKNKPFVIMNSGPWVFDSVLCLAGMGWGKLIL